MDSTTALRTISTRSRESARQRLISIPSKMVAATSPMSMILDAGCVAVAFEDKAHFSSCNKRDQVGNGAHELAL